MALRIAEAWGFDYDKQNLFPPPTQLEDLEEGSEGVYDVQPRPAMRGRPYGPVPLMLRPTYKGDFLEQLKEKNKCSADPSNLLDFSTPEEMLKHQEEPSVRDIQDDFYEYNRPGDEGYNALKDYYKRDWEDTEAPEMSEDKLIRMMKPPAHPEQKTFELFRAAKVVMSFLDKVSQPNPQLVVAKYLMEVSPLEIMTEDSGSRTAKYLNDLEKTEIFTKNIWHKPPTTGVSVRLYRAEPKVGRWTFRTSSGKESYITVFQFIPDRRIVEANKLNVRVSCSCPSFLFWGAQFNAVMGDYFYGKIRPKFTPPKKRDPAGRFLVCKHILACIPVVSNYRLQPISDEIKKKIKAPNKIELDKKAPKEELRIPNDLLPIGEKPEMKTLVDKWETMTRSKRRLAVLGLEDPEEVAYLAHRFPDTATVFVVEKLKSMASKEKKAEVREEAKELLQEII